MAEFPPRMALTYPRRYGCDRSADDAYSSMAPGPTFAFVGGPCCPTLDFVIAFWIMIYVLHIVNFAILYTNLRASNLDNVKL